MNSGKKIKNNNLFLEYKKDKNNIELRNKIFSEHEYIAEIIAKKYVNRGIEYEDLYQIACIGLIYSIDRYDYEKGFEFTTFATPTILGEIKKYFRDKSWTLKIPRRIQELSKKISIARNELSQSLQRAPTIEEIAVSLKSTEEEILEAMEASNAFSPKSIDSNNNDKTSEEKELNFLEMYGEEDNQFKDFENKDFVERVMKKLNPLEKEIINKRYLIDEKTQVELSKEIDISQVTISRIEKKILEKFKMELDK
jgi:RNA polymerase sigma-B factor